MGEVLLESVQWDTAQSCFLKHHYILFVFLKVAVWKVIYFFDYVQLKLVQIFSIEISPSESIFSRKFIAPEIFLWELSIFFSNSFLQLILCAQTSTNHRFNK